MQTSQLNLTLLALAGLLSATACVTDTPIAANLSLVRGGDGCPSSLPAGACSPDGLSCDYGTGDPCDGETLATCVGGEWAIASTAPSDTCGCPATAPAANEACADLGQECRYGNAALCEATTTATCTAEGWISAVADPPPACACPDEAPAPSSACSVEGAECEYGGPGVCDAQEVAMCSGGEWIIRSTAPSLECVCPETAPASGSACEVNGARCNYGGGLCEEQTMALCDANVWAISQTAPSEECGCPANPPEPAGLCLSEGMRCNYIPADLCAEPQYFAVCVGGEWGVAIADPSEDCE